MTVLDAILLALLAIFVIRGLFRGFLLELFDLVSLVAGYFAARWLGPGLGWPLADAMGWGRVWVGLLTTMLVFVLVTWGVRVAARMLKKLVHASLLGGVDRGLGGLFGALKTLLLALALFFIALMSPWSSSATAYAREGVISPVLVTMTRWVQDWAAEEHPEVAERFGRWLDAAGLQDKVVDTIVETPGLLDAVIDRAKRIELDIPVEDILEGRELPQLPESFHIDAGTQDRLLETLQDSSEDVQARAKEFWAMIQDQLDAQ